MQDWREIQADSEGSFGQIPSSKATCWVKRLPLQVGWHAESPRDLEDFFGEQVLEVEVDFHANQIQVRYRDGLEPLGLERLREYVDPAAPLGCWRLATLALQLARHLEQLRQAGLPQGFVHPQRIALGPAGFVLLPTLTGTLPKPGVLAGSAAPDWLDYADPEVLRTRADQAERLPAGEIFGLGMVLARIALPGWRPPPAPTALALMEQLVEQGAEIPPEDWPPHLADVQRLVGRLVRRHAGARPTPARLRRDLEALVRTHDPLRRIRALLDSGANDEATAAIDGLEAHAGCAAYSFPPATALMLRTERVLATAEPDFTKALDLLRRAVLAEPGDAKLHRAVGLTYRRYHEHPQHLQLAADAFAQAATLSGWQRSILDEWFTVLVELDDPQEALRQTTGVPFERRSAAIRALWVRAYLDLGEPRAAWDLSVRWLEQDPREAEGIAMARRAAKALETTTLIRWLYQEIGPDHAPAIVQAVVWERAGNQEKAREWYARAGITEPTKGLEE
jgi:tetratricopeptide (TPR) repeat protein